MKAPDMIAFLEEWLKMRVNHAPVVVTFSDGGHEAKRVMTHVDSVGVVFEGGERGTAYPWSAIDSIEPVR